MRRSDGLKKSKKVLYRVKIDNNLVQIFKDIITNKGKRSTNIKRIY